MARARGSHVAWPTGKVLRRHLGLSSHAGCLCGFNYLAPQRGRNRPRAIAQIMGANCVVPFVVLMFVEVG